MEEDSATGDRAIVKKRMEEKISARSGAFFGTPNVARAIGHLLVVSVLLNVLME